MKNVSVATLMAALTGCSSVPAFDLASNEKSYGSPIIRVASIMANLKCELYEAANDQEEMPQFRNDVDLRQFDRDPAEPDRKFNLQNMFSAISYVGEVELTIDAVQTAGTSPSLSFPGLGANDKLTVGIDGSINTKGHRSNTTYHSVDFERLVKGPGQPPAREPKRPCARGTELQGSLGLKDNLKMGMVASSMNDISVWPSSSSHPTVKSTVEPKYSAGRIHAVIDFTTTTSLSGGPTWQLQHFEGLNSGAGFLNYRREALNQVAFTFLPICIREKYKGKKVGQRWEYTPKLPQGTPGWANYLPPCGGVDDLRRKTEAVDEAHRTNLMSLDNIRLRNF